MGANSGPKIGPTWVQDGESAGQNALFEASEVASIVLLGNRLPQVVDAIDLSTKTFGKIKQNLAWAFGYNIVGIPIAAGALLPAYGLALTPSVAGAVMGVSSIGVMVNSLLLQLEGRKFSKEDKDKDID